MRVSSMQTVKITLAACAAALALAACGGASSGGSGSSSNSGSGSTSSGGSSTTDATSCKDQGKKWKDDNTGTLKDFESAVKSFTSGGVPSPASAKKLEDVANEAASHPLPSCADPKGLWVKAMHEVAKAAKSASKGGIEATAEALPELEKALTDLTKLQAEVKGKVDLSQV